MFNGVPDNCKTGFDPVGQALLLQACRNHLTKEACIGLFHKLMKQLILPGNIFSPEIFGDHGHCMFVILVVGGKGYSKPACHIIRKELLQFTKIGSLGTGFNS